MTNEYTCVVCGKKANMTKFGKHYCFHHGAEEIRRRTDPPSPPKSNRKNLIIIGIALPIILAIIGMWWTSYTAELESNRESIAELKLLLKEDTENQKTLFVEFGIESQVDQEKKVELPPEIIKQIEDKDQEIKLLNFKIEQLTNEKQQLDIDYSNKIANFQYYLGNYEQSFSTNNLILNKDPYDVVTLHNQGVTLSNLGNFTQALTVYDEALALDPNYEPALKSKIVTLSNYGISLSKLGNFTQALTVYDEALALDPKNIHTLISKGVTLNNAKNYTESINSYNEALTLDPNNVDVISHLKTAYSNLGVSLFNEGNYREALHYYDQALDLDPNDDKILELRENALRQLGKN